VATALPPKKAMGLKGMETVSVSVHLYRFQMPEAFLEAGIPPHKINKRKLRKKTGKRRRQAHWF
jgi:hypothetical protein